MNGRRSPDEPSAEAGRPRQDENVPAEQHALKRPTPELSTAQAVASQDDAEKSAPLLSLRSESVSERDNRQTDGKAVPDATMTNGHESDHDSEAETLIDSPVKKRELEKHASVSKIQKFPKHRIGGLPVPTELDDEVSSAISAPSTVMSVEKATLADGGKEIKRHNLDAMDDNSDPLSSPHSSSDEAPSRASSSRAFSERPEYSKSGEQSPNPRKRKHRASSVGLPNKRFGVDARKQRMRALHTENLDPRIEQSPSPKLRSHRRAVSTQSAMAEGANELTNRKRRTTGSIAARETKIGKTWEDSDASSETTSRGHNEQRRPQRGIGRSTSTPGRPVGRDHKRYVNRYGFTRLAEACENGDLNLVKIWRDKDPDQLELAEFAGNKPLQIAALNGNVEIVDYLIDQGCQIDCANVDRDTPLIDAAENGHLAVVESLLEAGVDPLRQNLKGQQAFNVVDDTTDDADAIRTALRKATEKWKSQGSKERREEEEVRRHRAGPTKEVEFMERTYENLVYLVQINDRNGVQEFLDARVPVDNHVIEAAAKTGDAYLVNMLLAEMTEKKAYQKPEKPMLGVLGSSHIEMVKQLTQLEQFNPTWRSRQGKAWPELAEERQGPHWEEEKQLLQELYDRKLAMEQRRSSSPIIRRDGDKRRPVRRRPSGDDTDEDQVPKHRNRRRLMTKRDMRAANVKGAMESSDEETSDEGVHTRNTHSAKDNSMKPPLGSPSKGPGRPRAKSNSTNSTSGSPVMRRRSLSVKGTVEPSLPVVKEEADTGHAMIKVENRESQNKAAAEEARELERKRKEEAEAAAAAAAVTAKRAEEEREEARRLEAAREEADRQAEAARREEEERLRIAQQMEQAKLAHRASLLAAVPRAARHILDQNTSFAYDNLADLSYLIKHFTPLQVLKRDASEYSNINSPVANATSSNLDVKKRSPFWVLNLQAAPLLGKHGLELMHSASVPGFEDTLAASIQTRDVSEQQIEAVLAVLFAANPHDFPPELQIPVDEDGLSTLDFASEMQLLAAQQQCVAQEIHKLRAGDVVLRFVHLDDVLAHLHPALKDTKIEVRFDWLIDDDDGAVSHTNGNGNGTVGNAPVAPMVLKSDAITSPPPPEAIASAPSPTTTNKPGVSPSPASTTNNVGDPPPLNGTPPSSDLTTAVRSPPIKTKPESLAYGLSSSDPLSCSSHPDDSFVTRVSAILDRRPTPQIYLGGRRCDFPGAALPARAATKVTVVHAGGKPGLGNGS